MAVTYKDIDLLSKKAQAAGTEKIPVSDTEYLSASQVAGVGLEMQTSQPAGGMLPGVFYALGELAGSVAFALANPVNATIANFYHWSFSCGATPPTVSSWPSQITRWSGGAAPTPKANKYYEVSVVNGSAIYIEI